MTIGTRKPGEFCWINILTPNPPGARDFFAALLEWTFSDIGMGHTILVGGRPIGGLFDLAGPNTPAGTLPEIGVMVKVESADDAGARVASLGGKARPAFNLGGAGRMAVCHDPSGANFDPFEPKTLKGTEVDTTQHGAPSWFELLTDDIDSVVPFYSALLGWESEVVPIPNRRYVVFKQGDSFVAGAMQVEPPMGNGRSHWATYFTVRDVDASAREAARLGARLFLPVTESPGIGKFCGISSPQGVTFYVIQYS
jgi:predicted enzyme related to lactoylglutathione lyase